MVIGIDVAKPELVVAERPSGERWTVANDYTGVGTLTARPGRGEAERSGAGGAVHGGAGRRAA